MWTPIYSAVDDEQKVWHRAVLATIIVKMAAIPEIMTPEHEKNTHYRQRFRKRKRPARENETRGCTRARGRRKKTHRIQLGLVVAEYCHDTSLDKREVS
jgi:hypothetical protein